MPENNLERKKVLNELNQYNEPAQEKDDITRFVKDEPTKKIKSSPVVKKTEPKVKLAPEVKPDLAEPKVDKINKEQPVSSVVADTKATIKDHSTKLAKTFCRFCTVKRMVFVLILLVIIIAAYSAAVLVFRFDRAYPNLGQKSILPIGLVQGQVIWMADFAKDTKTLQEFYQKALDSGKIAEIPTRLEIEKAVLERMIREDLIVQFAKRNNLTVTSSEIQSETARIVQEFGDEASLNTFIKENYGWNLVEFEQKIIVPYLLRNKVSAWFEQNESAKTAAQGKAKQLLDDLKANKITFEEANTQYNEDTAAQSNGGSLGTFEWNTMVPEFETALKNLKVGELSEPVPTSFGWHIIRRDEIETDVDATKNVAASHILIRVFDFDKWIENERQNSGAFTWIRLP